MKASDSFSLPRIGGWPFSFWAIAASCCAVHMTLTLRSGDTNLLFSSLVFWPAASFALKEETYQPKKESYKSISNLYPSAVGLLLLISSIACGLSARGQFLYLYPVLIGLGLILLFTGSAGLPKYWKALTLLFCLGVPEIIANALVDPAPLTARFSDTLLWYTGFDATRQGNFIQLWDSQVEVNQACSGLRAMTRMLSVAILSLLLLPRKWALSQLIGLPVFGILLAFVANGIRVAILVFLLASGQQKAFDNFHGGNLSQSFSLLSILVFMSAVTWLVQQRADLCSFDSPPSDSSLSEP